ncbi:MAG: hypothetical protein ACTSVV_12930 [Promethearchaeota archaeon]
MLQFFSSSLDLFIGIIFSLISGILFAFGVILQKKALMNMDDIKLSEFNSMMQMIKNKTWLIGIIIAVSGGLPYMLAQAFLGVTLTQPLILALQLTFTVLFAIKILGDSLEGIEIIGFSFLIISPIFLILGNVLPPDVNLKSGIFITNFLTFFIISVILCIFLAVIVKFFHDSILSTVYAVISGILFAIGALFAQIGVEIFKNYPELFLFGLIFLLILFLGNALATLIQQIAFQKGKIGIAFALQSTTNLLFSIIGGIFVFNQMIMALHFFILGLIFILIGNIFLVKFQARLEEIEKSNINLN